MNQKIDFNLTKLSETMLDYVMGRGCGKQVAKCLTLNKIGEDVEFRWSVLDTKEMETWNPKIRLQTEYYMSRYENGRYPFVFNSFLLPPFQSKGNHATNRK